MDAKHFNVLAIAAVVSLVTAGIVHSAYDTWSTETVSGKKLFPAFGSDANQVGQLVLRKGKDTFTFDKTKDGWTFAERGGYPVDAGKVRELLVRVARAELVEAKTRDPKRYNLLELGDPEKDDAKSTLVRLGDADGKAIGDFVVGKRRVSAFGRGKTGSYVRRPGDDQSWLTNVELKTSFDVSDWVEPVFFKMPAADITTLTLQTPDGGDVKLVVDDRKKNTFKFESVPQGKKLKSGIDASIIAKGLETLELTDVRKAADAKPAKGEQKIPVLLETKDGMKLRVAVLKIGEDERWVSVEVLEDGKSKDLAKDLRSRLGGWQFKIADWRARQVFKTAAEMFEAEPEKKSEADGGKAAAPVAPKPAGGQQ